MRTILILCVVFALLACVPKYARDSSSVTMENYVVTEIIYDKTGKIIGKNTMVPAKSEWTKLIDSLIKEFADLVGLADIPTVAK